LPMVGEFLVIGLGRFGQCLVLSLARLGQSVLAVDVDESRVQSVAAEIDAAVCADATDEAALRELHPERMTCAIVAIGMEGMQSSIMAAALLHQMGVPRIVARAVNELHARVLRAVGAHEIVNPEAEIGDRLAQRLAQPNVFSQMELGDETDLAEVGVPAAFIGKTLIELDVRRKYGVSVVAIRKGESFHANPDGNERLDGNDVLVLIGAKTAIRRLAAMA
jgi:trk system potassium uptake protein TrkA